MTAKEYLSQIAQLKTMIRNADDLIDDLRSQEITLRSAWPDGQPHGTGTTDPVGMAASKLADELKDAEYAQLQRRRSLYRKQLEITETLSHLERPEHNRLLFLRYVEGWTWEAIAEDMERTYQWVADSVSGLHGNALRELEKILAESEKLDTT